MPSVPNKLTKYFLLGILGVLFLGGGALAGYWYDTRWKTYQVMNQNEQPLGISYKLPSGASKPLWVNAGHYYKVVELPGNTTLVIIPIGEGLGLQSNWQEIVNQVVLKNNFSQKQTNLLSLPEAIEFSGTITTAKVSADLYILGEGYGLFRGVVAKVNDDLSLEILHYQDKFAVGQTDFASDEILFDRILSTFKFLD